MTVQPPKFNPELNQNRWVAYFDLLGTRSLVKSGDLLKVFFAYADAQNEAKSSGFADVNTFWFSDTFVFYSQDNSASDFAAIECVAQRFCYFLILKEIPVRGALSSGSMYSDATHDLFFGSALIEAHDYGESQDWLGFVLTPSAARRLKAIGLPPDERLDYAYWEIPFKKSFTPEERKLPACLFAGATDSLARAFCLSKLASMKANADQKVAIKYDNTIDFLNRNLRYVIEKC